MTIVPDPERDSGSAEVESLVIRPYRPNDRRAVVDISAVAWDGLYTMVEVRERNFGRLDGKSWRDHKTKAVLDGIDAGPDKTLVAEVGNEVVGYATYRIEGDIGTIGNNAVRPGWQGHGIGSTLIRHVVERLHKSDVRIIEVTTFEHDLAARAVYEKNGFKLVMTSKHYAQAVSQGHGGD